MSMCAYQLRELIQKTLKLTQWYSEDSTELLMLTACAESDAGRYLRQIKGPALGLFQVEPDTLNDIYKNWLLGRQASSENIKEITGINKSDLLALEGNIIYGILLTRIIYLRAPGKLPSRYDHLGMANYYVKWFNRGGKANPDVAVAKYHRFGLD